VLEKKREGERSIPTSSNITDGKSTGHGALVRERERKKLTKETKETGAHILYASPYRTERGKEREEGRTTTT